MSDDKADIEKKNILNIYAAFGAALVLSIIPTMFAAFLSLILGLGVLIAAYMVRKNEEIGSLVENHMTFVIRTIWIGSFFALISTTIGSIYLFFNLDNTPLQPCLNTFLSVADSVQNFSGLESVFGNCFEPYWFVNAKVFITSGIIVATPILVYFAARYARGLSRAMNGYRVSKPLSWF